MLNSSECMEYIVDLIGAESGEYRQVVMDYDDATRDYIVEVIASTKKAHGYGQSLAAAINDLKERGVE